MPRYLYVLTCDGRLDKLDTVENKKTASADLTKLPGEAALPSAEGAYDGCLAYQALYDADASAFYTVAPLQASMKENGTKDYRVVEYSLPQVRLIKSTPAATNATEPPHLELSNSGIRLTPAAEWHPPSQFVFSGFAPGEAAGNQLIEASGDRALLRLFGANPAQVLLGVADTQAKTLVRLQNTPPTAAANAHLTPGGAAVLIEEVTRSQKPGKTGVLALFDATTSRKNELLNSPEIRSQYFLAISPNGKAIYHSAEDYSFVDLKQTFSNEPVTRPPGAIYPNIFFADK